MKALFLHKYSARRPGSKLRSLKTTKANPKGLSGDREEASGSADFLEGSGPDSADFLEGSGPADNLEEGLARTGVRLV